MDIQKWSYKSCLSIGWQWRFPSKVVDRELIMEIFSGIITESFLRVNTSGILIQECVGASSISGVWWFGGKVYIFKKIIELHSSYWVL